MMKPPCFPNTITTKSDAWGFHHPTKIYYYMMKKKYGIWIYSIIITGFIVFLINSCKKEDPNTNLTPALTTSAVSEITKTTAKSGGNILTTRGSTITELGVCWSTENSPTIEDSLTIDAYTGTGIFLSLITGLKPGKEYFVRAYAKYYYFLPTDSSPSIKPVYGNVVSFSTNEEEVLTTPVTSRTQNSATCGGFISTEGGSAIIVRGVCWSTNVIPVLAEGKTEDGAGTGGFTSNLTGLIPNTTYYARAYAINSADTSYGNVIIVRTYKTTITDIDHNTYNTITIGSQVWMAENLKTTRFNDGTEIAIGKKNEEWRILDTPAYCWYNNDEPKYINTYNGALYNWHTVNTGKICPSGWHVPSDSEWHTLIKNLDPGFNYNPVKSTESLQAGGKLKESGTSNWINPNSDATNETGFSGLPGGGRNYLGIFDDMGRNGYWWSSTDSTTNLAWFRYLNYDDIHVNRLTLDKKSGVSIRCIED